VVSVLPIQQGQLSQRHEAVRADGSCHRSTIALRKVGFRYPPTFVFVPNSQTSHHSLQGCYPRTDSPSNVDAVLQLVDVVIRDGAATEPSEKNEICTQEYRNRCGTVRGQGQDRFRRWGIALLATMRTTNKAPTEKTTRTTTTR